MRLIRAGRRNTVLLNNSPLPDSDVIGRRNDGPFFLSASPSTLSETGRGVCFIVCVVVVVVLHPSPLSLQLPESLNKTSTVVLLTMSSLLISRGFSPTGTSLILISGHIMLICYMHLTRLCRLPCNFSSSF